MAGAWLDAGLPLRPVTAGYTEAPEDYRVRFQPESGPDVVRPASTARRTRLTCTFRVTTRQLHVFRAFYRAQQFAEFLMPDPTWLPETGNPDEIRARFESTYQVAPVSPRLFDVRVELLLWR